MSLKQFHCAERDEHFIVCLESRFESGVWVYMRRCLSWSVFPRGRTDVALLCDVSVDQNCGLSALMRVWRDQELHLKTDPVDRPKETTWVTSNSWVHTSGHQNATPPFSASLRTRTLHSFTYLSPPSGGKKSHTETLLFSFTLCCVHVWPLTKYDTNNFNFSTDSPRISSRSQVHWKLQIHALKQRGRNVKKI